MKKSVFKKLTSAMIAIAMLANGISVFAETENASVSTENEIKSYINNIAPYHLLSLGLDSEYDISEPMILYDWDNYNHDKYIFVVTDDNTDKMVGTITCAKVDGEITSSFSTATFTEIDELISKKAPFQLGGSNGCFILFDGTDYTVLENYDNVDESFTESIVSDYNSANPITIMSDNIKARLNSRSTTYSTSTPPLVVNSVNTDNYKGLCWAACVASKGACQTSASTTKTANEIYTMCKNSTGADRPDGDPVGTLEWTKYALAHCFSISAASDNALTDSDIIAKLNTNRPIICFIESITKYEDKDGDGELDTSQHGMLLWSLVSLDNNNGTVYVYMDPGKASTGAGMVSYHKTGDSTDCSAISIVSKNGYIYSVWNKSVY